MNNDTIQIKGFEDTIITFDVYPCGSIYIDPHSEGTIGLYYSSERAFLYQLKEKKLIDALSFSYIVNKENRAKGQICLGANSIDKKYKGQISAEQHKGYYNHWMFKLGSITFNNKETFLNTTVDMKSDSSMIGITKDYLISLKDSLKEYINANTVWVNNKINGNCDILRNFPNLNFTLGDSLFSISMKDFVKETKNHS